MGCRIVDVNVSRVLPREVAQAAMVPTTLVSQSLVRDVGKELPRFYRFYRFHLYSSGASRPIAQLETFPACTFVPGIPQGQPSYRRALHINEINIGENSRFTTACSLFDGCPLPQLAAVAVGCAVLVCRPRGLHDQAVLGLRGMVKGVFIAGLGGPRLCHANTRSTSETLIDSAA